MIRLSIRIQHDPRRADLIPGLLARIDHDDVQVVADPDPTNTVRSPWRTYLACLEAASPDATHLLILQDDATVCRDFAQTVEHALKAHPDDMVCLFVPGVGLLARAVMQACASGERWVLLPGQEWVPVVATVLPRRLVEEMRAWAAESKLGAWERGDDALVGRFCREPGKNLWRPDRQVWATVPSLVDHADVQPSLVNNPHFAGANPQRVAACWMGEEVSPLTLQWD